MIILTVLTIGIQDHILIIIALSRLQTLTANNLVCTHQHCLYSFAFLQKSKSQMDMKSAMNIDSMDILELHTLILGLY